MAWNTFTKDDAYNFTHTAASLKKAWAGLHIGDAEVMPKDANLIQAWIAFHAGDFEKAYQLGMNAGMDGYTVAHKAACIYATYLEEDEKKKIAMFEEVANRCEEQQAAQPQCANAFYWHAYALGRYAQGISVVKALSQGIAKKVRTSLDTALELSPKHADAHIAMGAYHAEIIDAVGSMIGSMTYGVKKEEAYKNFKAALAINPTSAIARIEYANAQIKLDGKKKMDDAVALYEEAAAVEPKDAMEWLDVEVAKEELNE